MPRQGLEDDLSAVPVSPDKMGPADNELPFVRPAIVDRTEASFPSLLTLPASWTGVARQIRECRA